MKKIYKRILIIFGVVIILGSTFVVTGIISSKRLVVAHQIIEYEELQGLKIAHFSDSHLESNSSYEMLENAVTNINEIRPDIVFFTGDLFDTDNPTEEDILETSRILSMIECPNIFAVYGNHDLHSISKTNIVDDIFTELNIKLLVNSNYLFEFEDLEINIIGLDDYMHGNRNYETVLETSTQYEHNIVLSHEPDTFDTIKEYDIISVFSGHSHGGQIRLPFIGEIYNIIGAKTYTKHYYYIDNTHLLVNFGLGSTVIPIRFYNPSILDIYTFE